MKNVRPINTTKKFYDRIPECAWRPDNPDMSSVHAFLKLDPNVEKFRLEAIYSAKDDPKLHKESSAIKPLAYIFSGEVDGELFYTKVVHDLTNDETWDLRTAAGLSNRYAILGLFSAACETLVRQSHYYNGDKRRAFSPTGNTGRILSVQPNHHDTH